MPLTTSSFETLSNDIAAAPTSTVFVLFTAKANADGKKWCPGCVEVEPEIERVFGAGDHYALAVYLAIPDFDTDNRPLQAWAINGVPVLYRLEKGELAGGFLMPSDVPFGGVLDAFVASPTEYEAYLEKHEGDEYVDPKTRWEWAHEDWARFDAMSKENKARTKRRAEIKAAQAKVRNANKPAANDATVATGENGIEGEPTTKTCNGVTCSA